MKRVILILGMMLAIAWSVCVWAVNIGVVNMQQIFHDSPQIKKINNTLAQQFSPRREKIVKMGKQLQADVQKYQKNKSVLSATELTSLQNKITQEETQLRQEQTQFQQELYTAQDAQMTKFMKQIRGIVQTIAAKKELTVVLPKNSVLYAASDLDITSELLSKLK